ncbi:nitronate monooxygenase [Yinghuangia aomiensis]
MPRSAFSARWPPSSRTRSASCSPRSASARSAPPSPSRPRGRRARDGAAEPGPHRRLALHPPPPVLRPLFVARRPHALSDPRHRAAPRRPRMLRIVGVAPWQYGLAFGIACLGGLVGSRLSRVLVARHGERRVLLGSGALRVCWPVLLAFVGPGWWGVVLVVAVEFVLITCIGVFNPVFAAYRLRGTDSAYISRVLAAWSVTNNAAVALSTVAWGLLASVIGVREGLALAGVLLLATPLVLPWRATKATTTTATAAPVVQEPAAPDRLARGCGPLVNPLVSRLTRCHSPRAPVSSGRGDTRRATDRKGFTAMALATDFTDLLGVRHPIALAPMGGSAGGALAAAVSRAGGLGLLGGADGDRGGWNASCRSSRNARRAVGRRLLELGDRGGRRRPGFGVRARRHFLSFGDPAPFVDAVRRTDAVLIVQVTDLDEAKRALEVGADVLVAQGTESGGHGARNGRSTLPFVPLLVDLAGSVPVLAAGGIADGRGLAAALALGAAGALVGTRFQATAEAAIDPSIGWVLVAGRGQDTERNAVLDLARGASWPTATYTARTLGHPYLDRWRGRETELASDPAPARAAYAEDVAGGAIPPIPVWAGEGVDLITDRPPAADVVAAMAAQAEAALHRAVTREPRDRTRDEPTDGQAKTRT